MRIRALLFALCALLLAPFSDIARAEPRVAKAVAVESGGTSGRAAGSVVLRTNDLFELRLSGMPDEDARQFSGSPYTVGADGQVSIPYAGKIPAAGRTPSDIERAIEKSLIDKKIFRWPNATINVVTSLRYVTVGGNVRGPQRMPWSADLTLLSALMAAGGGNDFAGDKINLVRGGQITLYSYKKLRKEPSQDPRLLPGDQIELL